MKYMKLIKKILWENIEHGAVEKKKQDKAIKNGRFDKKLLLVETRE